MGLATLWSVDVAAVLLIAAGGFWVGLWAPPPWWPQRARSGVRRGLRRAVPSDAASGRSGCPHRPIEESVARARRLARLHHGPDEGRSHVKVEGVRRAYDGALAECCAALGIVHLLEVLSPGPELDAERARVEQRLALSGVDLRLRD
jgi:hypothetical protein